MVLYKKRSLYPGTPSPQDPTCPSPCSCDAAAGVVDCAWRNLTAVPWPIEDSRAHTLVLDGNTIAAVDLAFLKHYPELRSLSVRGRSVRSLTRSAADYHTFFSLEHLDLSLNHLHMVHPRVFAGFPALRTLNLSNNVLHTLAETAFALPALETLDLSANKLEQVRLSGKSAAAVAD